jgi:hypothetical protein
MIIGIIIFIVAGGIVAFGLDIAQSKMKGENWKSKPWYKWIW